MQRRSGLTARIRERCGGQKRDGEDPELGGVQSVEGQGNC